jgi:uncharacterized ion transporter superfamily protein YfcC
MAILPAAGVGYEQWLRVAIPLTLLLIALGAVAVALAIAVGLRQAVTDASCPRG